MTHHICPKCSSDQTDRQQTNITCLQCGLTFPPEIATVRTTDTGAGEVKEKINARMVTFSVKPKPLDIQNKKL